MVPNSISVVALGIPNMVLSSFQQYKTYAIHHIDWANRSLLLWIISSPKCSVAVNSGHKRKALQVITIPVSDFINI